MRFAELWSFLPFIGAWDGKVAVRCPKALVCYVAATMFSVELNTVTPDHESAENVGEIRPQQKREG